MIFARTSGILVTDFDGVDDYISIASAGLYQKTSFKLKFSFVKTTGIYVGLMQARTSFSSNHGFTIIYDGLTDDALDVYLGSATGGTPLASGTINVDLSAKSTGDIIDVEVLYDGVTFSVQTDSDLPVTSAHTADMYLTTAPVTVGLSASSYYDEAIFNVQIGNMGGVIGQWHNTTWVDQINSADGTITGSPTTTSISDDELVIGDLLTGFDGVDDLVEIASAGLYDAQDLKIELDWIYTIDGVQTIAGQHTASANDRSFLIDHVDSNGFLRFYTSTTGSFQSARYCFISLAAFTEGETIHIKATYDGINMVLYADASSYSVAATGDIYSSSQPFSVGVRGDGTTGNYYNHSPIYNVEIGTASTIKGSWNNSTWADETASADGTLYGSPKLATLWP